MRTKKGTLYKYNPFWRYNSHNLNNFSGNDKDLSKAYESIVIPIFNSNRDAGFCEAFNEDNDWHFKDYAKANSSDLYYLDHCVDVVNCEHKDGICSQVRDHDYIMDKFGWPELKVNNYKGGM